MEETPKLKTIAENLHLSIGTVQRALHNKGGYSEKTKQLILKEAERLGYTPNAAASALRRSAIRLGVLLPKPEKDNRYFFSYLWQGIEKACSEMAIYQIEIVRGYAEPGSDQCVEILESWLSDTQKPVEGLITVLRRNEAVDRLIQKFEDKGIPVFVINSCVDTFSQGHRCFAIDANRSIGSLGADLFASMHRRTEGNLLLLAGDRNNPMQVARSNDFCTRMEKECTRIQIMETHLYHDLPKLKAFVQNWVQKMDDVVGIYAVSARETLTACQALSDVPSKPELTLIGTDAFPELLPFFQNGILTASIYQYPSKQSYLAVHILISEITHSTHSFDLENFPIVPVFRSIASVYCHPVGLI